MTSTLITLYKLHRRIIELQDELIELLKQDEKDVQLIAEKETVINELKVVLKWPGERSLI